MDKQLIENRLQEVAELKELLWKYVEKCRTNYEEAQKAYDFLCETENELQQYVEKMIKELEKGTK